MCTRDEAVGTHDDGDVVFNSKVGNDVYYLETIPFEEHVANLSVENDQEEPGQNDGDVEVIEAKAYKSIISWHERLGHLHGNAMRKILTFLIGKKREGGLQETLWTMRSLREGKNDKSTIPEDSSPYVSTSFGNRSQRRQWQSSVQIIRWR